MAVTLYGVWGVCRLFPRFEERLTGTWWVADRFESRSTMSFYDGGFGQRGNERSTRTFRWWTYGDVLVMHPDRDSRLKNLLAIVEYAGRHLAFMAPPADVTEFDIARLDSWGAHLNRRPRLIDQGVVESLVLRRGR